MKRIKYFLALPLILLFAVSALASKITDVRLSSAPDRTRFVLEFDRMPSYKAFLLKKPNRFVIDVTNTQLHTEIENFNLDQTPIMSLRTADQGHRKLRFVIDLKKPVGVNSFLLKPSASYRYRLVVDLTQSEFHERIEKKQGEIKKDPITGEVIAPEQRKELVVVIDPGHGGKDPGAIGPRRTREKNVTLAIAKELKKILIREPGVKVVLTRKGSYYVGLRQRLKLARESKADVFVSIHADAYHNKSSQGVSVYALSARGASSEAARWLAEKENRSELLGGATLGDRDNVLRTVLIDLSQTATIRSSLHLGEKTLDMLGVMTRLHHDQVEQAGFVVLKSPDIPSILIETGFLSNPSEEHRLRSFSYQQKLARAIASGLRKYFMEYPPQDTWLAHRLQTATKHRVRRSENLEKIVSQYNVDMLTVRRLNLLPSRQLRTGQTLWIPSNVSKA